MIMCTVCLGWNFGFQQYCLIFVVSLMFTDYSISQEQTIKKSTLATIALVVCTYFSLRLWTYHQPYVYPVKYPLASKILFVVNSIIAFACIISYSYMYSKTVYQLETTLVEVATKDTLTGLYNRRKMQDLLNAISEVLSTSGNRLCIAMVDIDKFKLINDTYGHDAGDEVLKAIAGVLLHRQTVNESFQACRWGGEEFLIFYRNDCQDNQPIINFFENLCQEIANKTVLYNG